MNNGTADSVSSNGPFEAVSLTASMTVNDLPASIAWYTNALGFTIDQKHEREGTLRAASLSAGSVRILLNQEDGKKGMDRVKGQGISLQFTTSQNIDAIATRIKSHGVTLASEPVDTPWGMRVFRLSDPDGYTLVISSPRAESIG